MRGSEFAELASFVAIAERGSFVKAAAVLGVSTSALSQTMRTLEERLGVRLLNPTTRSVALTEAGERLLGRIRPAIEQLGTATEAVNAFRDRPAGTLRLNAASLATGVVIAPSLGAFNAAYPDITLDITVDDGSTDIVEGHFDAGIRPGWRIERDMIATRISPESRLIAIASPDYLARHPGPVDPQDLHHHNCIRFRLTTGAIFRWGFEKNGERVEFLPEGSIVTNNVDLSVGAALDGIGIGYMLEGYIAPLIATGRLVPVLEDWALHFSGLHIFYPSRRQMPLPLRAFIEFLRSRPHFAGTFPR
jgi:DNA-binding transcriptional LysR family regulator